MALSARAAAAAAMRCDAGSAAAAAPSPASALAACAAPGRLSAAARAAACVRCSRRCLRRYANYFGGSTMLLSGVLKKFWARASLLISNSHVYLKRCARYSFVPPTSAHPPRFEARIVTCSFRGHVE